MSSRHYGSGASHDRLHFHCPFLDLRHLPFLVPCQVAEMSGQGSTGTTTGRNESNRPPPEKTQELAHDEKPPLNTIINLYDFEEIASRVLDKKTWAFYSSAATDCITRDANNGMLRRIWWRPRILRNVRDVSTETTILGCKAKMPLFVSPAALAKMVHPDGEKALARACVARGIPQGVCLSNRI